MGLLLVNFDHTVMMRSDLSTFLPTLGLLGAVLKKIRLRTHKKHQKTQKIYSKDRWHCIWNESEYVVIIFAVLCTYFSIHSTNFVRKMIPTFLKVKVCDSQRTFYFDQSSRSTTVQCYGKGEGHINCHKSQKFALFSEKPNSSSHNSPKYCT